MLLAKSLCCRKPRRGRRFRLPRQPDCSGFGCMFACYRVHASFHWMHEGRTRQQGDAKKIATLTIPVERPFTRPWNRRPGCGGHGRRRRPVSLRSRRIPLPRDRLATTANRPTDAALHRVALRRPKPNRRARPASAWPVHEKRQVDSPIAGERDRTRGGGPLQRRRACGRDRREIPRHTILRRSAPRLRDPSPWHASGDGPLETAA